LIDQREQGGVIEQYQGLTMGTTWSVRLVVAQKATTSVNVQEVIQNALDAVVQEMSNWEEASDISRFNRSPLGEWQDMPSAFLTVLRAGLTIAHKTSGAFDPAIGHHVNHWGFGPAGASSRPFDSAIPSTKIVSWQSVEVQDTRACRTADIALDFSAIAKGYGVDAVADNLMQAGYRHFLVEVGGELKGHGVRPDSQPWWVDIETPPGLTLPITRLALCGLAIATSGDYRRWFKLDGKQYSHSLDPRTGRPITNAVASVTVCHPQAMLADAWATALTVMGLEQGLTLAARENLAALMVIRQADGSAKEYMSPAFAEMLE
jgi:thiamine biosynthesis lipoprotein